MEEIKIKNDNFATLPEVAAVIAREFHELEGRSIAVSAENIRDAKDIKLPVCLVALFNGAPSPVARLGVGAAVEIQDEFTVQFMFPTERYQKDDGSEAPLWAYYDYVSVRHRLFSALEAFASRNGISFMFTNLEVESDDISVVLVFRFRQEFEWCSDDVCDSSEIAKISLTLTGC